jgi:DNA-directed RNA polymerase specialized sigma24 family protein
MDTPPTDDAGLLDRLRAGDPLAPSQFCERFLPVLLGNRGWAAGLTRDGHAVEQAAHDALLAFVRRPHAYDPSGLALIPYLRNSARCDLLNALKREQRHAQRRAPLEAVELRPPAGNNQQRAADRLGGDTRAALLRRLRAELPDPLDWDAMCLLIDGVRETAVYARLYGLEALPVVEQTRQVKRHKDRLKKRAIRLGVRINHG